MNYFQQTVHPHAASAASAAPSMSNIAMFITEGLIAPVFQGLGQVAANFSDTMGGLASRPARTARDRTRGCGCGCGCEAEEACHCTCCIVDADVVIYSYLGERKVVPLVVENKRVREKDIKVSLGEFTRAGKPAPVKGVLLRPTEFKLPPCSSHNVVMVVETEAAAAAGGSGKPVPDPRDETIPDVEECTVYYADLQVDGCEMRPLRIALAVLPRDCGAYRIRCRECCC